MAGRSPCNAKSSWLVLMASFTAGPAPLKNSHSMRVPDGLNASSSQPRACAMAKELPAKVGGVPVAGCATPMRITSGRAAPTALNALNGPADAAAPRPDTARRLRRVRRVIAILSVVLCPVPEGKEGERRGKNFTNGSQDTRRCRRGRRNVFGFGYGLRAYEPRVAIALRQRISACVFLRSVRLRGGIECAIFDT